MTCIFLRATLFWIFYSTIICKTLFSDHCIIEKFSNNYTGKLNVSMENELCLDWKQFPYNDNDFPENSIVAAKNYCRNPKSKFIRPFCHTPKRLQGVKCHVLFCTTVQQLGQVSQSSTYINNVAELAILGNKTSTFLLNKSCSATNAQKNPFWKIVFPVNIKIILVYIKYATHYNSPANIILKLNGNKTKECTKKNQIQNYVDRYLCLENTNEIEVNVITPNDYLMICYIKIFASFKSSPCQHSANMQGYTGMTNTTKSNRNCVNWEVFNSIIEKNNFMFGEYPNNYCRTLLDPYSAWCFIEKAPKFYEKHYCLIEECSENTFDCLIKDPPMKFLGFIRKAGNGQNCQYWHELIHIYTEIEKFGTKDEIVEHQNFCRNFDDDPMGPWCYTIEYKNPKRYCYVPYCIVVSSFTECTPKNECNLLVNNDNMKCKSVLRVTTNPWFTLFFPYEIDSIAVILYSKFAQYFKIETSINNINWATCAAFYKSHEILSTSELFKCISKFKSIRIMSLNENFTTIEICQFQVLINQPYLYTCQSSKTAIIQYIGSISTDINSQPCLYWSDVINKYKIKLLDNNFIFNSPYKSKNYCRSPILNNTSWCYIKNAKNINISPCKIPTNCKTAFLNVKCRNPCYSILMSSYPSCEILKKADLNINSNNLVDMPNQLVLQSASKFQSYIILVVSKHFSDKPPVEINETNNWNIEYVARDVKGEDLRLGIFPMRKIELKKWMFSFSKSSPQGGWLYLLILVLNSLEYKNDIDCLFSFGSNTFNLNDLEELGFLKVITATPYFVQL